MKQYIISVSSEFNHPSHYNSKQILKDLLVTHEVPSVAIKDSWHSKTLCIVWVMLGSCWSHYIYLVLLLAICFKLFLLCSVMHSYVRPTSNKLFSHPALYRSCCTSNFWELHGTQHSVEWQWVMKNTTASLSNWLVLHECKDWFTFPPRMHKSQQAAEHKLRNSSHMLPWCSEFTNHNYPWIYSAIKTHFSWRRLIPKSKYCD